MLATTRLAAHRGGAQLWAENSVLAFRNALALGADLVELDVHLSADGELVVIHDPTLDRTTDGAGAVVARPAAELRRLRLREPGGALTDERLPLLADVLVLTRDSAVGLLVEVKGPRPGAGVGYERRDGVVHCQPGPCYEGLEERLVAALAAAGVARRTTIMAFNPEVLGRVRALDPAQRTTLLVARGHLERVGARPEAAVEWTLAAGASDLGLEHAVVDEEVLRRAHAAGLGLGAWTANEEDVMRRLVGLGVDVLTTDRPDVAKRVLGR
ncbi:MAG: glycerophosphodiester phosphodiesterase [Candidatus Rokuibacteriota bacterium]